MSGFAGHRQGTVVASQSITTAFPVEYHALQQVTFDLFFRLHKGSCRIVLFQVYEVLLLTGFCPDSFQDSFEVFRTEINRPRLGM